MRVLSLLGFGAFVLASFAVGARLLLLARRTRQVPELAIGLADASTARRIRPPG